MTAGTIQARMVAISPPDHQNVMGGKSVRKLRVDAHRIESTLAAGERFLQDPLDRLCPNGHLGDFPVVEELLEAAVGNSLDLRIARPEILDEQNSNHGGNGVPDRYLALAGFRFHVTLPA